MSFFWWLGQTGICIEVVGAALGVWHAWRHSRTWREAITVHGYPAFPNDAPTPLGQSAATYTEQARVFGLIATGLVLQFAGNFGK
jgi:hypothetical protein